MGTLDLAQLRRQVSEDFPAGSAGGAGGAGSAGGAGGAYVYAGSRRTCLHSCAASVEPKWVKNPNVRWGWWASEEAQRNSGVGGKDTRCSVTCSRSRRG